MEFCVSRRSFVRNPFAYEMLNKPIFVLIPKPIPAPISELFAFALID